MRMNEILRKNWIDFVWRGEIYGWGENSSIPFSLFPVSICDVTLIRGLSTTTPPHPPQHVLVLCKIFEFIHFFFKK
jgi:hypothetical protein